MITFLGIFGVLTGRKNLISLLLTVELIYAGIVLIFLLIGIALSDFLGQIYGLSITIIAAAESVLMLGLIIIWGRRKLSLYLDSISLLGG